MVLPAILERLLPHQIILARSLIHGGAVAAVEKVRFHMGELPSRLKLHLTVGHSTVMATATFFGLPDTLGSSWASIAGRIGRLHIKEDVQDFSFDQEYLYQSHLYGLEGRPAVSQPASANTASAGSSGQSAMARHYGPQWALLHFDQPVTAPRDALVIGSRLDASASDKTCRLALYGRVVALINPSSSVELAKLKLYKVKSRNGIIKRVDKDGKGAVGQGLFKRETDLTPFTDMKVTTGAGKTGTITGSFGKSGKFRISFPDGISQELNEREKAISMVFKRFVYDRDKRHMAQ